VTRPLGTLLAPLLATLSTLLGTVDGHIRQHLLATTWVASLLPWVGQSSTALFLVPYGVAMLRSSTVVYVKLSLRSPWRNFHMRRLGHMPVPPGDPIGEPRVQRTDPFATVEHRMRSQLVVTVPSSPHKASWRASTNRFWPKPGYKLGQIGPSRCTPLVARRRWHGSLPVGSTTSPPRW
jgi:hypothetical protein